MSSGDRSRSRRLPRAVIAAVTAALAVRLVRSRHRRSLHPDGRSFAGELEILGPGGLPGVRLPERCRVTLRISKGVGTRGARADIRGLAVRLHLPDRDLDLLLSTAGRGRLTRHLPAPRRTFDTRYGTITAYRATGLGKVYLLADPDPDGPELGRTLDAVAEGDRMLLKVQRYDVERTVGRVTFGRPLPATDDAALAFDPVRNSRPGLHPTGFIHGVRAFAYRWSQRWRGATPAPKNPAAVARTTAQR
jgi:hypothetical protein